MISRYQKFLESLNINNLYTLPSQREVVERARKGVIGEKLDGKEVMRINVEHEAKRLNMNDSVTCDWTTDVFWAFAAYHHKRDFEALANKANQNIQEPQVNNDATIALIERIPEQQIQLMQQNEQIQ